MARGVRNAARYGSETLREGVGTGEDGLEGSWDGLDVLDVGVRILPLAVFLAVVASTAGRVSSRVKPKWIAASGLAFALLGVGGLAGSRACSSTGDVVVCAAYTSSLSLLYAVCGVLLLLALGTLVGSMRLNRSAMYVVR